MDRVKAAQECSRRDASGAVEQRPVHVDLMQASELAAGLGHRRGAADLDGSYDLEAREGTGQLLVESMEAEVPPQGIGLGLLLHELHDRRRIEVDLQRSSSRITVKRPDASNP